MEAELGPPPEDVLCGFGPFMLYQIFGFPLVETGTETLTRARGAGEGGGDFPGPGPVGLGEAQREGRIDRRVLEFARECRNAAFRQIAAGQGRIRRPGPARLREKTGQPVEGGFGELPVGGDLASEHMQESGLADGFVFERVAPTRLPCRDVGFFMERPHAGEGGGHLLGAHGAGEVAAGHVTEIGNLCWIRRGGGGVAGEFTLGGADQGEIPLIGKGEKNPAVGVLEDIGPVVIEEAGQDDMAAPDEAGLAGFRAVEAVADHFSDPGAGCVDQDPRGGLIGAAAAKVTELQLPVIAGRGGGHQFGARVDAGSAPGGVQGVEDHEPGVVHPAIGVFVAAPVSRLQGGARFVVAEVEGSGGRQVPVSVEPVIEPETGTDHELRASVLLAGQDEAERADDMGRDAPEDPALVQGFADQAEFQAFEIAKPAMDEFGGGRGRAAAEIPAFDQQHREAPAGRVARDSASVHTAADDREVDGGGIHALLPCRPV